MTTRTGGASPSTTLAIEAPTPTRGHQIRRPRQETYSRPSTAARTGVAPGAPSSRTTPPSPSTETSVIVAAASGANCPVATEMTISSAGSVPGKAKVVIRIVDTIAILLGSSRKFRGPPSAPPSHVRQERLAESCSRSPKATCNPPSSIARSLSNRLRCRWAPGCKRRSDAASDLPRGRPSPPQASESVAASESAPASESVPARGPPDRRRASGCAQREHSRTRRSRRSSCKCKYSQPPQ